MGGAITALLLLTLLLTLLVAIAGYVLFGAPEK